MADNFWDALEGRTQSEPSQQEAPAFNAPAPTGVKKTAPEAAFKPSAARVAERAAAAASEAKKDLPTVQAASPTDDFLQNILGMWQIPAAVAGGAAGAELVKRGYKTLKDKVVSSTPLPPSATGVEPTFNQPVATPATSAAAPQTVMTASGPVNLEEVPKAMRPIVEKSAQITQQKMGAPLAYGDIPEIPTLGSRPIAPSATPTPAATAAPMAAPAGGALPAAPAAAPSPTAAVKGAVAPDAGKAEKAMLNWVRGQMKQRGFADMSDDAVKGFLKTFYGDAPIAPGAGYAPEGYGARFSEWAKQNIAGPGVGMPREEMKAIKARDAVKPPSSQQGSATLGNVANVALNAAGGLMLLDMFKKAQQTGDYSDFAMGAIGQVLGNVAPRAAGIGFGLMQPNTVSAGTLNTPEAQAILRRQPARGYVAD